MPTSDPRRARLALVLLVVGSTFLSGCTEQEFRELMLTLAFGLLVLVLGAVVISIVNLVVLGGGIATLAINLLGTPTHRARTYGFVFGGLNIATGVTGLLGAISAMFVFHQEIRVAFAPGVSGQGAPGPDLFVGGITAMLMSLGSVALGVGCIVAAARAKAVDLVPRSELEPPRPAP
jgi:hypothetical protein